MMWMVWQLVVQSTQFLHLCQTSCLRLQFVVHDPWLVLGAVEGECEGEGRRRPLLAPAVVSKHVAAAVLPSSINTTIVPPSGQEGIPHTHLKHPLDLLCDNPQSLPVFVAVLPAPEPTQNPSPVLASVLTPVPAPPTIGASTTRVSIYILLPDAYRPVALVSTHVLSARILPTLVLLYPSHPLIPSDSFPLPRSHPTTSSYPCNPLSPSHILSLLTTCTPTPRPFPRWWTGPPPRSRTGARRTMGWATYPSTAGVLGRRNRRQQRLWLADRREFLHLSLYLQLPVYLSLSLSLPLPQMVQTTRHPLLLLR